VIAVQLFGRRPAPREGDTLPDASFGFLTVREAARLRALTREAFARRGVEVDIRADHLRADDGVDFGLHNLFATCHNARRGEREWPAIITDHVARMLRARQGPDVADLPAEEILAHAFVRVVPTTALSDLTQFGYRRPLVGDLVELLAFDTPDAVVLLPDEVVSRVGVAELSAAGVHNLLVEPFGSVTWLESGDVRFGVVIAESVHTASRLLTVDDVLRRDQGEPDAAHGTLLCVPNRHQLGFHVVRDARVLPTVEAMVRFAVAGYDDGVGSVSPHLYYRSAAGDLQQVTSASADGDVEVHVHGAFADALDAVVGDVPDFPDSPAGPDSPA
jgi:hypothetical protein